MKKQERKIVKLIEEAADCTSRKEAKKILSKHSKARAKLYLKRMINDE